jgi:hypothetical protein
MSRTSPWWVLSNAVSYANPYGPVRGPASLPMMSRCNCQIALRYACDNDVVDHQVVSIEYQGGVTASFTATAFSGCQFRKTRLFGTHGCIEGDSKVLDLLDFRTGRREWVPIQTVDVPK